MSYHSKATIAILVFSLSFNAAYAGPLCIEVYSQNIRDAKPIEVPGLGGAIFKGGWKGYEKRKQIIRSNQALETAKANLQKRSTLQASELTILIADSVAKVSPQFQTKLNSEVEPFTKMIEKATSEAAVTVLVNKARQKHDGIVSENKSVGEVAKQARIDFVAKLESVPRYKHKDTVEPINQLLAKIAGAGSGEIAKKMATDGMSELSRKMVEFSEKESVRKVAEKRLGEQDLQNAELVMNGYVESIRRIDPAFENLSQQALGSLNILKVSPEFRKFIYNEMQFLRRAQRFGIQNRTASLELRIRNNLEIQRQYEVSYSSNPAAAESALKMKLALRSKIKELFSPAKISVINEDFRHLKLNHDVRENILKDSIRQPELLATLLTLTMKYPELPAEPVKPSAPVKPNLYTKRDFRGKSPSTIKTMVASMKRDIAKFSEQAKAYPGKISAYSEAKAAHKIKVKEVMQLQHRIKTARASFASYLSLTAPQIFNGKAAMVQQAQAKNKIGRQVQHNIKSLSKANYQRLVDRYPQYSNRFSRYRNESSSVFQGDNMSFFDIWLMASITNNPMWFISPTFARVQLFIDLMSNGTIDHNHPERDPVVSGYIADVNLQHPNDQIQIDTSPNGIKERYEEIRQAHAEEVNSATRAEAQLLTFDTAIIDNQSKHPVVEQIDPLLREETINELDSADALLKDVRSQEEIEANLRAADQDAIEAQRIQEEADLAAREAEQAQREAEQAEREAQQAQQEAEQAQREAEQAAREAEQAQQEAEQAQREAEQAQREAEQAARDAQEAADQAARDAQAAADSAASESYSSSNNDY
tara:strand:+ start:12163 stop:14619 length:2457 start_codon:yes stop_codon:yes gene_type:complete